MANNDRRKPIVELEKPGGKIIKYWESGKKAADFYNISQVVISYNVTGVNQQAKGHYFRFATKSEISQYSNIVSDIDKLNSKVPVPVVEEIAIQTLPPDTIPEVVKRNDDSNLSLTPFEQLLEDSKKKLMNNSK